MDLSLVVHTCDSYRQFWFGMLYSLELYWDFEKIPVYWASEEQDVHDFELSCRGHLFKPHPTMKSILTGKTDKNGFSTRMKKSLSEIPSKWVIYLQEDMWLKSSFSYPVLEQLLLFAEVQKAESIKIHTKLHYYEAYRLEPTPYFINRTRIMKHCPGENYLHSHNATIWNREYLIQNIADGEDPWTNEVEGSKRMSSRDHNHYHYNVHWYSQPGICEKGQPSSEYYIMAPILDDLMSMKLSSEKI